MMIGGRTLLSRVVDVGRAAIAGDDTELLVATDDERVLKHARDLGCTAVMTDETLATGSARTLVAALDRPAPPTIVCCLQGDTPFIPPDAIQLVLQRLARGDCDCATPVVRLGWEALDALRAHKCSSPTSGTTCVRADDGRALWFSKAMLPQIRGEELLRREAATSPVYQHLGLYAYTLDALITIEAVPPSTNEVLEGLEQLRILELGLTIQTVELQSGPFTMSGIDTPADILRAERLIAGGADTLSG